MKLHYHIMFILGIGIIIINGFQCSIFEADLGEPVPNDVNIILHEIMNEGDLQETAGTTYDPTPALIGLLHFFINESAGKKIFSGYGLSVEPLPGAHCGAIRSIHYDFSAEESYEAYLGPDITQVLPNIFKQHHRIYYDGINLNPTSQANFMTSIQQTNNLLEAKVCEDDLLMLGAGVVSYEFHLHQFLYFNVYHVYRDELSEEYQDFLGQNFYAIEFGIARDHFPDKATDGSGFVENQYSLTLFIGLKNQNGDYIKFKHFDSYTIVSRTLWVNGGGDFSIGVVKATAQQIGEGLITLLSDLSNYMTKNFQPLP